MGGGRFLYIEEAITRPKCLYYFGCMDMVRRERRALDCTGCKAYIECGNYGA